jgi:hypothetical protein
VIKKNADGTYSVVHCHGANAGKALPGLSHVSKKKATAAHKAIEAKKR